MPARRARTDEEDEERRQPTLADLFTYNRNPMLAKSIGEQKVKALQAKTRRAHRFVFDEEASVRTARTIKAIPDLIVREAHFARAPFDLTWIEYQAEPYWQILQDQQQAADSRDTRVGFLIDHSHVYVVCEGENSRPSGGNGVYPIAYTLNTEWSVEDQLKFADLLGTSRLGIDAWMWGSSASHFIQAGEHHLMRKLRDHNRAEWIAQPGVLEHLQKNHRHRAFLTGAQGDLRTITTLLLMLNRPAVTRYRNTLPNRRGWIKNQHVPYLSHTTIHVNLDATETLRLTGTPAGEGVEKRRHEVRGHYCHDRDARDYLRIAGCIHEWEPTKGPEDDWEPRPTTNHSEVNHWRCRECGGKRWWRQEHQRGSAEIGFVIQDNYEVTHRQ